MVAPYFPVRLFSPCNTLMLIGRGGCAVKAGSGPHHSRSCWTPHCQVTTMTVMNDNEKQTGPVPDHCARPRWLAANEKIGGVHGLLCGEPFEQPRFNRLWTTDRWGGVVHRRPPMRDRASLRTNSRCRTGRLAPRSSGVQPWASCNVNPPAHRVESGRLATHEVTHSVRRALPVDRRRPRLSTRCDDRSPSERGCCGAR